MLLYSGIITLDYNPQTDILITRMPDVRPYALSEVSFCLGLIVDSIRNYDIKNLLLDASHSVLEVDEDTYQALTRKFALDLRSTRLQKMARVGTLDSRREEKATKVATELSQELNAPIAFQNFSNRTEALQWLLSLALA